jgi:aminoglycoside/choline kinase family phosphotransferase
MAAWPRVLCHRDFHSRNLMVHAGRLHWIDFQDARLGPATYDLASLLRDSYVDIEEEFVAERAEEFRQRALPGEAKDVFARRFELTSVQRNLKALGTFGYMATVRQNPVYLQYVPRTLANARRNLLRHSELRGLHRVLARHVPELG